MPRVKHLLDPKKPAGGYFLTPAALLLGLIKLLVIALVAFTAAFAGVRFHNHTSPPGYVPAPLNPAIRIGGGSEPLAFSLNRFIVRLHNQQASFSCVGQTLSTQVEIERAERGQRIPMSAGFIWNQVNGGIDQGVSYQLAYGVLTTQGDDPLSVVSLDGYNGSWYFNPDAYQRARARPFLFSSWHAIRLDDRPTIEHELAAGHPLAFAAPWDETWKDHTGTSPLPYLTRNLLWWHSLVIVAYSPYGVEVLNSWPWGDSRQEAWLSWDVLARSGGALVVAYPNFSGLPAPRPQPTATPKPKRVNKSANPARWNQYRRAHHRSLIAYRRGGRLTPIAAAWTRSPQRLGGILGQPAWKGPRRGRKHGYMLARFQGGAIYYWPDYRRAQTVFSHAWHALVVLGY